MNVLRDVPRSTMFLKPGMPFHKTARIMKIRLLTSHVCILKKHLIFRGVVVILTLGEYEGIIDSAARA